MNYIAAPYSHKDPAVIAGRMACFDAVAAKMLLDGQMPVSPLLFHSLLGKHKVPGNWDFFEAYSLHMLDRCDALYLITLPGWEDSVGVAGELRLAEAKGMYIHLVEPDPHAYQDGVIEGLMREFPELRHEAFEPAMIYGMGDPDIARLKLGRMREALFAMQAGAEEQA